MRVLGWVPYVALGLVCSLVQGSAFAGKVDLSHARETPRAEVVPASVKEGETPLFANRAVGVQNSPDDTKLAAARRRREEDEQIAEQRFRFFVLLLQIFRAAK